MHLETGQLVEETERCFRQVTALPEASAESYQLHGGTLTGLGQVAAKTAYDAAIHRLPALASAFYERGQLHAAMKQLVAARADCETACRLSPRSAEYWLELGNSYKTLVLQPRHLFAYLNRTALYVDCGQFDAAQADYDEGDCRGPR